MKEMCLTHNNYDKISDRVMWLGNGAALFFNIELYYNRKDYYTGNKIRENYHKEILYKNNDYNSYRAKIIREFNYYFSIEINRKDVKTSIRIGPNNIYFIIFNLNKVVKWFIGEDGVNTIFNTKNGKLFIPTHPDPIKVELSFDQYIEFEPAICNINGYETIGVNVFLSNDAYYFFMSSSDVFSLLHMLNTCNMYMMAQNMLNYLGRPEFGTNAFDMETMTSLNKNANNSNSKSFFNLIGAEKIQ